MKKIPGVDMSSRSFGQGISAAVGMALAAKLQNKDYRTYTLLGDGEIQEGQVWEAAMFAGSRKLDNLVVIVDNNGLQIDGPIDEVNSPYPIGANSKHLTLMWLKLMVTTLIRSLMRSNRQKNAKENQQRSL